MVIIAIQKGSSNQSNDTKANDKVCVLKSNWIISEKVKVDASQSGLLLGGHIE